MPLYLGKSYIGGLNINTSGGGQLPTLSNPAAETEVFDGYEYIDETGAKKTGTFTVEEELLVQGTKIAELQTILAGKAGGGSGDGDVETCRVEITDPDGYLFGDAPILAVYTAFESGVIQTKRVFPLIPLVEDPETGEAFAGKRVIENVVKGSNIYFLGYDDYWLPFLRGEGIENGESSSDEFVEDEHGYSLRYATVISDAELTIEQS